MLWSSDMRIPERWSPEVLVGISTTSWPEVTCKNVQWRRSWHLKPWNHEGRCNFHESCAKAEYPHNSRKWDHHGFRVLGWCKELPTSHGSFSSVQSLILIPMKQLIKRRGGGWNLVSPHKWKAWKAYPWRQIVSPEFPKDGFSCKTHTNLRLRLTKEGMHGLTEQASIGNFECRVPIMLLVVATILSICMQFWYFVKVEWLN